MRVELLTCGDELLSGAVADTNGAWLMARLHEGGVLAARNTCVGDDLDAISEALTEALQRGVRLLVICGGLGPTEDDITAAAAAKAAGVNRGIDHRARALVERQLAARGAAVTDRQLRQALLPEGASALENVVGTAPGFSLKLGDCKAFFLPGPPAEFCPMVEKHVLPWLARSHTGNTATITLKTFGYREASLADLVDPVADRFTDVKIGYHLVQPEIHLRLRAQGATKETARQRCEQLAGELEQTLGEAIFGRNNDTLAAAVGEMLADRCQTLALAESCTGGLLGEMITASPGASRYLLASLVTYSDEMKVRILEVPRKLLVSEGAVSEACVRAMAEGARAAAASDHSLAVTGVAGPAGGTEEKPVGTVWLAHSNEAETVTMKKRFHGDREAIRRHSAHAALDLLRRRLA